MPVFIQTLKTASKLLILGALAACASTSTSGSGASDAYANLGNTPEQQVSLLNRVSWGANTSSARELKQTGVATYLERQLKPAPNAPLPPEIQAQIDAMTISQQPVMTLAADMEARNRALRDITDDDQKKAAQTAYQQDMNRLSREAQVRLVLREVYSPNQLQEQMTWFWLNHFNVYAAKSNLRALVGDYEQNAIRPHALGKFRDLLGATVRHPAMLRYLDNEQNAANRINENYAREIMELHTMGVGSGYSQKDVQELARVLTGLGVNFSTNTPKVRPALSNQYVRDGAFEFNPNRHDYGDKVFLGQPLKGRGLPEINEALDRLSRAPATAHFISQKLAIYFVSDTPPKALVDRMTQTFLRTDGDIADTLRTLFSSQEFAQSLGKKFKDPLHYAISGVRLAYDDKPILNAAPILNWLSRMGEPLYGHETPDGYPLLAQSWTGSGQMTTRFEIARTLGYSSAGLFKSDGDQPVQRPAFPMLANDVYYQSLRNTLSPTTQQALAQAGSQQEWNTFLLASPEFMNR